MKCELRIPIKIIETEKELEFVLPEMAIIEEGIKFEIKLYNKK